MCPSRGRATQRLSRGSSGEGWDWRLWAREDTADLRVEGTENGPGEKVMGARGQEPGSGDGGKE